MGVLTSKDMMGAGEASGGNSGGAPVSEVRSDTKQWKSESKKTGSIGMVIAGAELVMKITGGIVDVPRKYRDDVRVHEALRGAGFAPVGERVEDAPKKEEGPKKLEGPYKLTHPDGESVDTTIEVKVGKKKPVEVKIESGKAEVDDFSVAEHLIEKGWFGELYAHE